MNRGGVGSASIVLVFAVLCLAIFTVITFVPALNEEAIMQNELRLVTAFYEADTLAEQVFAEIIAAPFTPSEIHGIPIDSYFDFYTMADRITFTAPITETRGLHVVALIFEDSYEILTWRMYNMADWQPDDTINVWPGHFDDFDFIQGW